MRGFAAEEGAMSAKLCRSWRRQRIAFDEKFVQRKRAKKDGK